MATRGLCADVLRETLTSHQLVIFVPLSSALNGNADLLVTGDKELLNLGKIEDVEIVSPGGFRKRMRRKRTL